MRLQELRKARQFTQLDLGLKIGCAQATISQYENGTRMPNISMIKKLAKALNVSVSELIKALE